MLSKGYKSVFKEKTYKTKVIFVQTKYPWTQLTNHTYVQMYFRKCAVYHLFYDI